MRLSKKQRLMIFDRAYDKAAKVKPGEKSPLFPIEEEVLQDALRLDWNLRVAAKKIVRQEKRVPTLAELRAILKKEGKLWQEAGTRAERTGAPAK